MNSLLAILWLDLKRFWLNPARLLFSLVQPLLYLFVLGSAFRSATFAVDGYYQAYIFPGVVALSLMFTASSAAVGIVFDRQVGFLKALMVAPVPRVTIALGKILSGALLAWLQSAVLLPFAPSAGIGFSAVGLILFVLLMLFSALVFSALGLALALPFRSVMVFPVVSNALLLPMFFLSGALYPLDMAPDWIRWAATLDPAAYSVDLLRGLLTGRYLFAPLTSLAVLSLCLLVASAWIVHSFRRFTHN